MENTPVTPQPVVPQAATPEPVAPPVAVVEQPDIADHPVVMADAPPLSFITREPVAVLFVVQTGIALAVGFGLDITTEQMSLVLTFTGAVLSLITRQHVTPFVATGIAPAAVTPPPAAPRA